MHRPAPNIYEGELIEMTETVIADLKRVARTDGAVAIYIGNGHAGWEAATANILAPGHRALVSPPAASASAGRRRRGRWGSRSR